MTSSSSEQPPKETLEALDELYKFVDGLDPDFIIRERISIIKSRIQDPRVRPHPAPAEGRVFTSYIAGAPPKRKSLAEHDAATARQAREDFCEGLKKDLESRFIPSSNEWSKGRNSGLIECCNIIDEHRSTPPQTEQEQPR